MFQRLLVVALCGALTFQGAIAKDKIKDKAKDKGKVDVTLTAPAANSSVTAPATLTVAAQASSDQASHPVVKVEFFAGTTLIGTATSAPYAISWTNVAAGNYQLSAQATNDKGDRATSTAVAVNVNAPPSVALTAPLTNTSYTAPATMTLNAAAMDSDGSIARVDFLQGTTLIGSAIAAPYTVQWANVVPGNYSITAIATDNQGAATTSSAVVVNVNAPPVITLTAPATGTSTIAPAAIALRANASDTDGSIAKVEFFHGTTLLASVTSAPYSFDWTGVAAGNYTLTAIATDNQGATATTAAILVNVNAPPTVSLTAPTANTLYTAPAGIILSVAATDADGTIARVDFFQGATLLGSATSAPYTVNWSAVPAGTYSLTAVAIDQQGATATSQAIAINVNAPPSVALTAPGPNASFTVPGPIALAATATDTDGTIGTVAFYAGTTLLGTVTQVPYSLAWTDATPGTYRLTTVATDQQGATTTSAAVTITVIANTPPTVAITAPGNNHQAIAPATLLLTAAASDAEGSVTQVAFYEGATLLATLTQAPYTFNWSNIAPGSYTLFAQATDHHGAVGTSPAVNVSVAANAAPTVTLTVTPATAAAPASITLSANATDADGSIAQVAFFQGATLLATVTTAPYTYSWTNVAAGSYVVTARATDHSGAGTTSAPVTVTVASGVAQAYFIETDHLGTPRIVTDQGRQIVWQWDNNDPFGNNVPVGNGVEFNLRFPGQYFDRETSLHYNYFRDYDPATGRYVQSDPIGLQGGINTYAYAYSAPISYTDSTGLLVDENGTYLAPAVAVSLSNPVTAVAVLAMLAGTAAYEMCEPNNNDKCKKLISDIFEAMGVVEKRLSDLYVDKYNQYNIAYDKPSPSLPKNTGSYKGHINAAESAQNRLRNLIQEAKKLGCKIPKYAWELAYATVPTRPALPIK